MVSTKCPCISSIAQITCMYSPVGIMQLIVLVLRMKNASAKFQRKMDWVPRNIPTEHPYIDDIIFGFDD